MTADIGISEHPHQPGNLDFMIVEKDVSVTEFRRKLSAVWAYLETTGHVIFFTRRGKRECVIMSVETHACLRGDYEKTMREVEAATAAWREEQKARRKAKRRRSMIPAKIEQFLKTKVEPDFFIDENRSDYAEIHESVRQYVKSGTETITFHVDVELLLKAEAVLKVYGWTLGEAMVLFLIWCVLCPDRMQAWYATAKDGGEP